LRLLDLTALGAVVVRGSIFDPKFSSQLERAMFLRTLSRQIIKPVMPDDEAFDYLPTQAVADFLAAGSVTKLDGILFPSVQAGDEDLNVVLFHKAARVAALDIPEGTKLEASTGHWDDEDWEADFTVYEEIPPKKAPASDESKEKSFLDTTLLVGKLLDRWDGDNREAALRIDIASIHVHEVQQVEFKTNPFKVSRHRWENRETPY
jgi:hypothetical protein